MPPVLRRLISVSLLAGAALAVDPTAVSDWSLNGPEPQLEADGTVVFLRGFVGRLGDQTLMANAVRFNKSEEILYATGQVVYRRPEIRITAERLGLKGKLRTGEAWGVTARVEHEGRVLSLTADRLELSQDVITLRDVVVDMGHGASMSLWAPTVRILLREPPTGAVKDRKNLTQSRIAGVELISPTGRVVGLPVLWFPYIYRDFTVDYPWTVVRGGSNNRLGTWGRFWIGTAIPEFAGWKTVAEARVDRHSRAGNAGGLNLRWQHPTFGRGRIDTYAMPNEHVRNNDNEELMIRRSRAYDVEHRKNLGAGAIYLRSLEIPDPDDGLGDRSGHRFLSDFLPDSLERRPFPRKSAAITYTLKGLTLTTDAERRHTTGIDRTERLLGIEGTVAPVQVAGPLHAGGQAWLENLHRDATDTSAKRLTGRGYLAVGHWFPGAVGLDGLGGIKATGYHDGILQDVDQDQSFRRAFYTDNGISWRVVGQYDTLVHVLTPRVGFEATGRGVGDVLPTYGFDDGRDPFEEDQRFWTTSLATAVISNRTLFHADVKARWAVRKNERFYTDKDGQEALGPGSLVDVSGRADGSPLPGLTLTTTFLWDARPREWISADGTAQYLVTSWLYLSHETSLRTRDAGSVRTWEHRPSILFLSGRYLFGNGPTFRPADEAPVDGWRTELRRSMVEGDLFMSAEYIRDANGDLYDRRYTVGFTLGGATDLTDDAQSRFNYAPR